MRCVRMRRSARYRRRASIRPHPVPIPRGSRSHAMTPRTRCAASGTMARSSGVASWCSSARPSDTSQWDWRKPSGAIGSCGSCTSNWGASIATLVGLRRHGTVGGVGRHRDREDRCGNAVSVETTHRFPQRLGNLAHNARFPHSHSGPRHDAEEKNDPETDYKVLPMYPVLRCYRCFRLRRARLERDPAQPERIGNDRDGAEGHGRARPESG